MIEVEIDFSKSLGAASDQGLRPTCLVFAASAINAAANCVGHLSAEFLCHHAVKLAQNWKPDCGFQMDDVLPAVANPGQPVEQDYPYQPTALDQPLINPPSFKNLHKSQCTHVPNIQVNEVVSRVQNGQAVGVIIQMARSVWKPHSGVINFDPLVLPDQYHALIAVGTGKHLQTGEKHMLLRNSWGSSWGIDGHAWMSTSHLNLLLIEGFFV
jgi:Papain family cysteine protease